MSSEREGGAEPGGTASGGDRALIVALFFVSGAAGLIYEVLWGRMLGLEMGNTAHSLATVLTVFMGGLALGSWLSAQFSSRFRLPILAYAVVEGLIGVIALLFHTTFVTLSDAFYFSLLPSLEAPMLRTSSLLLVAALSACGPNASQPQVPRDADRATRESIYDAHELTLQNSIWGRKWHRADGSYDLKHVQSALMRYPSSRDAYDTLKMRTLTTSLFGAVGAAASSSRNDGTSGAKNTA